MRVFVDADACPVTEIAERICKIKGVAITLICDTNHVLSSSYADIHIADAGADSVDLVLVNLCKPKDIVITQDYGVAAMALAKRAYAIHQSGMVYTDNNISTLLERRHIAKELRRSSSKNHLKGPAKRTKDDDINFEKSFDNLLCIALANSADKCNNGE